MRLRDFFLNTRAHHIFRTWFDRFSLSHDGPRFMRPHYCGAYRCDGSITLRCARTDGGCFD